MPTVPRRFSPGRPTDSLLLTEDEKAHLERLSRRHATAQSLAKRAKAILLCAQGKNNKQISQEVGLGQASVGRWRGRFIKLRMEGLTDAPRSGAPR